MKKRRTEPTKTKKEPTFKKKELVPKSKNQAEYIRCIVENHVTLCTGPAGSGKAQPLDSTVWTPDGPVAMGNIDIGSIVLTEDGGRAKVLNVFPQGEKDIYLITFSDGQTVECCKEHLWTLCSANWKNPKTLPLEKILESYKTKSGRRKYYLPTIEPVDFDHQDITINPYLLGCLIGDGGFTSQMIRFSTSDKEIIDLITPALNEMSCDLSQQNECDYNITGGYLVLKPELEKLGLLDKLSYYKFIPKQYIYNSKEVRLELLSGLLDTDGYCDNSTIEFSTASYQLALDVQTIVQSLGGLAKISSRMGYYTKNNEKINTVENYRVFIRFNNNIRPFKLTRKKEKLLIREKYFLKRYIDSIEKISKKECQCILIDSKNHLYLTDGFIQTHNTAIATGMACEALLRHDVDRIVITRPVIESGKGLGFLPGNMLEKVNPYMVPIVEEMKLYLGDQMNMLKANNTIEICPLEYMRGRNFHNTFMILDEAQNCTFEQIKMFLTRIGVGSKVIINGDTDQSDLPEYTKGGFKTLLNKLQDLDGVGIAILTNEDVVRNGIIPRILDRLKS
jgi:phosphate starvation-inducible protein PhoH